MLTAVRNYLKYLWLWHLNTPLDFHWVDEEENAQNVGASIEVQYHALHDMKEHSVRCELTRLVLIEGLQINSVRIIRTVVSRQSNPWSATATIQPCYLDK